MKKLALAALGLVALTGTANAYDSHHGDPLGNRRQAIQERRIEDARRRGELTRGEYARLQAEQARIDELQRRAARDGHVDRYEAEQIRRAQNEASRHIRQEANDGERRGNWYRRWW
jgi:hypothetical protein